MSRLLERHSIWTFFLERIVARRGRTGYRPALRPDCTAKMRLLRYGAGADAARCEAAAAPRHAGSQEPDGTGASAASLLPEHRHHPLAFLADRRLDPGDVLEQLQHLLDHLLADLLVRHLPAAEEADEQHLVAVAEELPRLADADLQVVFGDARPHAHLLDLHLVLLALARLLLLLLLVLVLAVVHDTADRRALVRGDLDQVERLLDRHRQRIRSREHAQLPALVVDDEHLLDPDLLVDARTAVLGG